LKISLFILTLLILGTSFSIGCVFVHDMIHLKLTDKGNSFKYVLLISSITLVIFILMLVGSIVETKFPKYLIILVLFIFSFILIGFGVCQIVLWNIMVDSLEKIWTKDDSVIDVLEYVFHCHGFKEDDDDSNSCYPKFYKLEKNHGIDIAISSFLISLIIWIISIYGFVVLCCNSSKRSEEDFMIPLYTP
jgi:hypothetical protein